MPKMAWELLNSRGQDLTLDDIFEIRKQSTLEAEETEPGPEPEPEPEPESESESEP